MRARQGRTPGVSGLFEAFHAGREIDASRTGSRDDAIFEAGDGNPGRRFYRQFARAGSGGVAEGDLTSGGDAFNAGGKNMVPGSGGSPALHLSIGTPAARPYARRTTRSVCRRHRRPGCRGVCAGGRGVEKLPGSVALEPGERAVCSAVAGGRAVLQTFNKAVRREFQLSAGSHRLPRAGIKPRNHNGVNEGGRAAYWQYGPRSTEPSGNCSEFVSPGMEWFWRSIQTCGASCVFLRLPVSAGRRRCRPRGRPVGYGKAPQACDVFEAFVGLAGSGGAGRPGGAG